jgi:hypothetical protein
MPAIATAFVGSEGIAAPVQFEPATVKFDHLHYCSSFEAPEKLKCSTGAQSSRRIQHQGSLLFLGRVLGPNLPSPIPDVLSGPTVLRVRNSVKVWSQRGPLLLIYLELINIRLRIQLSVPSDVWFNKVFLLTTIVFRSR